MPRSTSTTVPNWLIRQLCTPYGSRLPKKPKKWEPYMDYPVYGGHAQGFVVTPTRPVARPYERRAPDGDYNGNLEGDEYRFFIGIRYTRSPFSTCRMCGASLFGIEERRRHMDVDGQDACTVRLVQAYKALLREDQCVVCSKICHKKSKFGVPLCSEICVEEWKFNHGLQYKWQNHQVVERYEV